MADIFQIFRNIETLDVWDITLKVIKRRYLDTIEELNKEQLLDGRTAKGKDISPSIDKDSYFKTPRGAEKYIASKKKKGFTVKRKETLPNFKMSAVGKLVHSKLNARIVGDEIIISVIGKGADFDLKYKNIYGLSSKSLAKLIPKMLPEIIRETKKHLQK